MNRKHQLEHLFGVAPLNAALLSLVLAASSCSGKEFTACNPEGNCASVAGGLAGFGIGGSRDQGAAFGGSAGAVTSGNNNDGEAGASGASACADTCKEVTPVCDTASNTCVQCLKGTDCNDNAKPVCDAATNTCVECTKSSECSDATKPACDTATNTCVTCVGNGDCKDSAKPFCDKAGAQCVACLKQADCTSATASACNAGACTACTTDSDCSNIAGKGVCDAGTCVQCTAEKESVCGGKSCDPATNKCTQTPVGTVNYCRPCLADSECIGGNQADQDARCVPMKFGGMQRPGGFCLKRVAKTCSPPFGIVIAASSLSGAPSESYCGIDQTTTRCEAVLDLVASRSCPDGLATSCGCTRDQTGTCIDTGQGGLCKDIGAFANKCTIPCASADQCLTTQTCPGGAKPYCQ